MTDSLYVPREKSKRLINPLLFQSFQVVESLTSHSFSLEELAMLVVAFLRVPDFDSEEHATLIDHHEKVWPKREQGSFLDHIPANSGATENVRNCTSQVILW
jgi:hypothetical protein